MSKNYRLISDLEPSDKDMEELMHEVAIEAKKKADIAKDKLTVEIKQRIDEAFNRENRFQR